jgi:trimeric autotransporter adhesin
VQIGSSQQLTATLRDASGNVLTGRAVAWSSSNATVATVNNSGLVSALNAGSTTITATSEGRSATAQVSVTCGIQSVVITPRADTLRAIGETRQFTAAAYDAAGMQVSVAWSSLNSLVATVSSEGLVTAQQMGTALIVATATVGGCTQSDTVGVVVDQVVEHITLNPSSAVVPEGSTVTIEVFATDSRGNRVHNPKLQWSTASAEIATVDGTGKVTGQHSGSTQVTARSDNNVSAAAPVQVIEEESSQVHSVTVTPSASSLAVGSALTLTAVARDSSGNVIESAPISWSSSSPAVASVQNGVVTGLTAGSAIITAASGTRSGTAAINVTAVTSPTVHTVTVSPTSASVAAGATTTLQATARDASNNIISGASFTWQSSAPGIATVSNAGVVTGVASGSAVVTVASGGQSATASISVTGGTTPTPPPPPPNPTASAQTNNKFLAIWGDGPGLNAPTGPRAGYNGPVTAIWQTWRSGTNPPSDPNLGDSRFSAQYSPNGNIGVTPEGGHADSFITASDRGRWIQIRVQAKVADPGSANGILRVWKDGVLVSQISNAAIYAPAGSEYQNAFRHGYLMGWANSGYTHDTYIYVDDFRIIASNPGW